MQRTHSFLLSFVSITLGAALGSGIAMASSTSSASDPLPMPKIDASKLKLAPTTALIGKTTLLTKTTVASLAAVPEAKLGEAVVVSPNKTVVTGAQIAFHCATWVQPGMNGAAPNALFKADDCTSWWADGAVVWFNASADKDYMVECAGTSEKWRLEEAVPGATGQVKVFSTATEAPWMLVRPTVAGWHGVHFGNPAITGTDSFSINKCRIWPISA